jgi:hypothetical protein
MLWCFEKLFWKYAEKTFRQSVISVTNCGSICHVYFAELREQRYNSKTVCWTAQTGTKCMLLNDKQSRAIITPSFRLRRTWLMEHFNRPISIMINDVESNDFYSRLVSPRNSNPTFKQVFFSLRHYESRVATQRQIEKTEQPHTRFHVSIALCCW